MGEAVLPVDGVVVGVGVGVGETVPPAGEGVGVEVGDGETVPLVSEGVGVGVGVAVGEGVTWFVHDIKIDLTKTIAPSSVRHKTENRWLTGAVVHGTLSDDVK